MCESNIRFWRDYWDTLFTETGYGQSTLNMISPRVVLRELIEEAETQQLQNKGHRDFLFGQIKDLCKHDPPTKQTLLPILSVLQRQFGKPLLPVVVQIARQAIEELDTRAYFNSAVDTLCDALFSEDKVDRKSLKLLCQDIIVELSESGFSREYIRKLPDYLFSNATPVDGLPPSERIKHLKKLIQQAREKMRVIFQVKGLKGDEPFHIAGIEFYSPEKKQLVSDFMGSAPDHNLETFAAKKHVYMNGCVPVEALDSEAGASEARRRLNRAIDILRFHVPSDAHYEISQRHIIIDPQGVCRSASSPIDPKQAAYHWSDSLNVDERRDRLVSSSEKIAHLASVPLDAASHTLGRKIAESIHWYRKAAEAESDVDRLLSYWISIENVLNPGRRALASGVFRGDRKETVTSIAFELLPKLAVMIHVYQRGWQVYRELKLLWLHPLVTTAGGTSAANVPKDLRKKAGFAPDEGQQVWLRDFVEAIPQLKPYFADSLLGERLTEIEKFFTDAASAKEILSADQKRFRIEVVLLYRVRNAIVHGAKYEDSMAPFFVRSARHFCRLLLETSAKHDREHPSHTHAQLLGGLLSEYDILLARLENSSPRDVFLEK